MTRKRGQNEGSIFQRKDGRWCAVLNLGWENGRRRRKSVYGHTAEAVQSALLKLRHDSSLGLPIATARQTVGEFLARWLEDYARPRIKPRSYERFAEIIRLHIKPVVGNLRIERLSPADVQRLLNLKLREGFSSQTVVCICKLLRSALSQAVRWGLVPRNVATLADAPRIQRSTLRVLSLDEARRLLEAAKGDRHEALYSVGLALGLRCGELLGLAWSDVDLDSARIGIFRSLQRIGGRLQLTETKTPKSRRTVQLPQYAVRALRAHRARQLEDRLAAGSAWAGSDLVFTNRLGGPIEPTTLRLRFRRLLTQAGLPQIRLHDLRHGAASLMLAQSVPMKTIQEILGHSSISITADLYAHLGEQLKREATDAMDAFMGEYRPILEPA
jgi:integrase